MDQENVYVNLYKRAMVRTLWNRRLSSIIYYSMDCCVVWYSHDDVIKWKHFPRNWPFVREIHRSPVNFPHKGQRRGALMFSLIYAWINDWVNNREAGDLRRQHGHYDVIVMSVNHCQYRGSVVIAFQIHRLEGDPIYILKLLSHCLCRYLFLKNLWRLSKLLPHVRYGGLLCIC